MWQNQRIDLWDSLVRHSFETLFKHTSSLSIWDCVSSSFTTSHACCTLVVVFGAFVAVTFCYLLLVLCCLWLFLPFLCFCSFFFSFLLLAFACLCSCCCCLFLTPLFLFGIDFVFVSIILLVASGALPLLFIVSCC